MDRSLGMDPVQPQQQLWPVSVDGEEARHLESRHVHSVGEEQWDTIRDTAASVLSRCPDPQHPSGPVTGLAIGRVQSGKTLSYTTLIALAIDNGYQITVVLAGTKNPLLEQNYNRLFNDLAEDRPSVTPFKNPPPQDAEVIRSVLHGRGHVLIVVLKNRKRIDDVRRILATPELCGYPTLIIDDEGDEASLNTQFRRSRRSPIYNSILGLRNALTHHAYIAYTATPQANLLISGIDGLSPDFGVLIEPGPGYCGGSEFFGERRDGYVRVMPADDGDGEQAIQITDGLKRAIAAFLVGGAIRHMREPSAWHSMLIHNSNLRAEHQSLKVTVQNLIELWKERLNLRDSDPASQDIVPLLREAYTDLCSTVANPPTWDDVYRQLHDEIWLVEVWMVNSLPLGRDPIGTPFRLKNNILVGGNMLGRGVTIPGLAVTYITRRAKKETNADTMEQRARWFGYKSEYLDLCRIYVTDQLRNDYTALLQHEDDFWEALRRNQHQGLSIREWPRMLRLDTTMGLNPTRQNVANYRQFRGQGWDIQKTIIVTPQIAQQNIQTITEFFRQHPGRVQAFANTEHTLVQGCPTEVVINDLLTKLQTEGTDWENNYTIEYLERLFLSGSMPTLDVLWMSKGAVRSRALAKDSNGNVINNRLQNPMQGRTDGKRPTEREYYPGDEHLHGGRPQLQVHMIEPEGSNLVTTVMALYVPPDDPRYDLKYVVRDEHQ